MACGHRAICDTAACEVQHPLMLVVVEASHHCTFYGLLLFCCPVNILLLHSYGPCSGAPAAADQPIAVMRINFIAVQEPSM